MCQGKGEREREKRGRLIGITESLLTIGTPLRVFLREVKSG